ncbi:MarR family transcriptional regulator [Streptomyces sp. DH8]|uniref:MarR family transcriptional regulator n=1 Tax=Streptomyces sp. DH8 TaxID=2857008 RepID=UPI001E30432B|nr:MarR family transcriptional regulator [Streptomyces sp. DH8]
MAKPGYGKRSAPNQRPRTREDFALLPTRERYVAGFVDHLPEGAAMSVKQLAKQLPLYGQQAISTSLSALSVAGHLRRVRCPAGTGDQVRWTYRTFWSRTARDNEWWNTYLATETAVRAIAPADAPTPPPPWATAEEPSPPPTQPEHPAGGQAPEPTAVSQQRAPLPATGTRRPPATDQGLPARGMTHTAPTRSTGSTPPAPAPAVTQTQPSHTPGEVPAALRATPEPKHSPAYVALARLGRDDHRLALSAADCATLEPLATAWLARGVNVDYLTSALTAGLPTQIDSPAGLLRRRLIDKLPPLLPAKEAMSPAPGTSAPVPRILMECTTCGRPGPPEALPDGLCRPCHHTPTGGSETTPTPAEIATVKAHMANLRHLLKPV